MGWFRSPPSRRRDLRRGIPTPPARGVWTLLSPSQLWAALWVLSLTLAGGGLALLAQSRPMYREGQLVRQPIVTRVAFKTIDQAATASRKADARDREPAVYVVNKTYFQQLLDRMTTLGSLGAAEDKSDFSKLTPETIKALKLTPEAFDALRRSVARNGQDAWSELASQFLENLKGIAIVPADRARIEREPIQRAFKITIKPSPAAELDRADHELFSPLDDAATHDNLRRQVFDKSHVFFEEPLRTYLTSLIMQEVQPTYVLDKEETDRRRLAKFVLEPPVEITYQANEVMIPADGERRLNEFDLRLLAAEQRAYEERRSTADQTLHRSAALALMGMIGLGLWAYVGTYAPRVTANPMRGLAVTGLLILAQAAAVMATSVNPDYRYATATLPVLFAAIVLAIAYEQRLAMAISVCLAILVTISLQTTVGFLVVLMTAVGVAITQITQVRTRSKLLWVGWWTGLSMFAATWMVETTQPSFDMGRHMPQVWFDASLALATGIATGLLVQGVLPAIEGVFKVTTAMTLKELNDASHPLLRRLAEEAPGSYQHSLRLADIVEAAAGAIGANALLCKVGAMYHDVGKINKPQYFIENQSDGNNRHAKLSPAMSLLIIVGHVKDGMEMAREYHLPQPLRHFIESHHGTTLVEYFYHAARKQSDAARTPAPDEFEFRYPGPKPQTREAAILMLGDSVESAARTLDDPSPSQIESLVHQLANKRLADGQFNECNLTLQELHGIEESMIKTLCAMYHGRIKYPTSDKSVASPQPRPATP